MQSTITMMVRTWASRAPVVGLRGSAALDRTSDESDARVAEPRMG